MTIDQEIILERGIRLASAQLYHAALEELSKLPAEMDDSSSSRRYDEIGKVFLRLGLYSDALANFQKALTYQIGPEESATYRMHEALAHRRLGDYDKAQRLMVSIIHELANILSPYQVAILYSNLSVVQGLNEFFIESLKSAENSLKIFERENITVFLPEVLNNIGTTYLELHEFSKAEEFLQRSMQLNANSSLATIIELSRLYFESGKISESMEFTQQATLLVWSSIMTYEKNDIARLCTLLARVSYNCGELTLAVRLLEKAQLIFGQIGLWREWERTQYLVDSWIEAGSSHEVSGIDVVKINQFLSILNIINSQEVTMKNFSSLLDLRVIYSSVFADYINLSDEDKESLIYISRLGDYGLTVLEQEILINPHRSESAWKQYIQHSNFSVEMLESVGIGKSAAVAIADHHENFDGTGFPSGKREADIAYLARVFSIIDFYTSQVQMRRPHSEVIQEMCCLKATSFDPEIVDTFIQMFD